MPDIEFHLIIFHSINSTFSITLIDSHPDIDSKVKQVDTKLLNLYYCFAYLSHHIKNCMQGSNNTLLFIMPATVELYFCCSFLCSGVLFLIYFVRLVMIMSVNFRNDFKYLYDSCKYQRGDLPYESLKYLAFSPYKILRESMLWRTALNCTSQKHFCAAKSSESKTIRTKMKLLLYSSYEKVVI